MRTILPYCGTLLVGALLCSSIDAQQNQSQISSSGNSVTTVPAGANGVSVTAASATPDVSVKTGNASTSAFHIFNSSSTELLRVQANGNVGIGTTAPGDALTVGDSTTAGKRIRIQNGGGASRDALLTFIGTLANSANQTWYTGINAFATNGSYEIKTAGTTGLTIDPSGNVGIGTSAPNTLFDVNGGVATIGGTGSSFGTANRLQLELYNTNTTQSIIRSYNRGTSVYGDIGLGELGRLMVQGSTGNVGIGTASPSQPLTVNGQVYSLAGGFKFPDGTTQTTAATANNGYFAGNVGIGTSAPNTLLDVNGGVATIGGTGSSFGTANRLQIELYNPNATQSVIRSYNRGAGAYGDIGLGEVGRFILKGANGWVGIGTATPGSALEVAGIGRFGLNFSNMPAPTYGGILIGEYGGGAEGELQIMSANSGYGFRFRGDASDGSMKLDRRAATTTWSGFMTFTVNGNVGIGTSSPLSTLQINTPYSVNSPARFEDAPGNNGVLLDMTADSEIDVAGLRVGTSGLPNIESNPNNDSPDHPNPLYLNLWSNNDVIVGSALNTTSGLQVNSTGMSNIGGSLTVHGTVYANYQDVAEWVPATASMAPGTVVVISDDTNNTVMPSTHAYDTGVAGVVSPTPGLLLGVAGASKAKIATTGRVKVRVDASKGPIRKGDLLVSSDRPGMAMKSEPIDVAGVKIHRPGTLIGKALEPLERGKGEGDILVLLSLQ
jgi:hypothetical protein